MNDSDNGNGNCEDKKWIFYLFSGCLTVCVVFMSLCVKVYGSGSALAIDCWYVWYADSYTSLPITKLILKRYSLWKCWWKYGAGLATLCKTSEQTSKNILSIAVGFFFLLLISFLKEEGNISTFQHRVQGIWFPSVEI